MQRFSKKREAIIECFSGTKSHPTAEWVYNKLKPLYPDLSLGTVYRNIRQLKEQNIIKTVCIVDGNERYDYNTSNHPHFICNDCGKVIDVESKNGLVNESFFEDYNDFLIKSYELTLQGLCKDCQK